MHTSFENQQLNSHIKYVSIVPTKPKDKQVGNKYLKYPNQQHPALPPKTHPEVVQ